MRRGTRRTSGRVQVHPPSPKYHHRLPAKQQTDTSLEFRHKHARTCARSGADIHTHSLLSHVHTSTPHAQHERDRSSRSELLITSSLLSGVSTFSVLFRATRRSDNATQHLLLTTRLTPGNTPGLNSHRTAATRTSGDLQLGLTYFSRSRTLPLVPQLIAVAMKNFGFGRQLVASLAGTVR